MAIPGRVPSAEIPGRSRNIKADRRILNDRQLWPKDLCERVLALLILIAISPVAILTSVVVRCTSRGPVLYRQERVGLNGKHFDLYKFRTMTHGAHELRHHYRHLNEATGPLFKIRDDPRVTRTGRILRKYSIDEVPQLICVLRGDMALVGPRPALPEEVTLYDEVSRQRLQVRPGLTGLAQISGRSHLTWEESIALDLAYVSTRSFRLDIDILIRTPLAVVTRRGAW